MIKRAIYTALGAVELAVAVYDWVKRWISKREEPFPMKPKGLTHREVEHIQAQIRAGARPPARPPADPRAKP